MGKNPFTDRPEASKNLEMLKMGQRVLIIEKHKQGTTDLTEGYINGFLTSKGHHPQGVKVSLIRSSFLEGKNILDIDPSIEKHMHKIGTMAGDLDVNQFAIGRVQYLVETEEDIEVGDTVQITKTKKLVRENDLIQGEVLHIVQYEIIDGEQKTLVEITDGTKGWVQKVQQKNKTILPKIEVKLDIEEELKRKAELRRSLFSK